MFSERANFLAFDEDAFDSLLRKILVREVCASAEGVATKLFGGGDYVDY